MKVIIWGAGEVGKTLAQDLSKENNDITIIDQSDESLKEIKEHLDVNTIVGFGSQPAILNKAGASGAEMLIAVTQSDEINMIACQLASSLFSIPIKIARVRAEEYNQDEWKTLFDTGVFSIDTVISPEYEVAKSFTRLVAVPGAKDLISFGSFVK